MGKQTRLVIAVGMLVLPGAAAASGSAQEDTRRLPLPPEVKQFAPAAGMLNINGMPTRVRGFLSPRPADELAHWYRQELGAPVAENRIGRRLILGQERDGRYLTVQLDPVAGGTRGVVALASAPDIHAHHGRERESRDRWQNRLPAGSRLLSHISSTDAGQEASFIAYVNRHDEIVNQQSLKRLMREDGLELEREVDAGANAKADAKAHSGPSHGRHGSTLYFKGGGSEAIATISRTAEDRIAVVLNIIRKTGE